MESKWLVLLGVSLACLVAFIDFTIVSTVLPNIQLDLTSSLLQLQWVMNIFVLVISMTMVTMGRLGDVVGRRFLLLIGIILFAIASLGAGLAPNPMWLIFFRGLQGLGTAILIPSSIAAIAIAFPSNEVGRAMGIWNSITGIGLALGPVLGGAIVSVLSWRYVFLINVPLFMVSFFICVRYLKTKKPNDQATKSPFDWLGCGMMSIAIACLVIPVVQSSLWGWTSPLTLTLFTAAVVAFIVFIYIELHVPLPIIQFNILSHRNFLTSAFANFCLVGFIWFAFFLLPLYLHDIRDYSSFYVGLILVSISGALTLTSPFAGYLSDKVGSKIPIVLGLIFLWLSVIGQFFLGLTSSVAYLVICLIIMGVGWGMIIGPAVSAAVQTVPTHFSGLASGALWTIQNIGGALGLAIGAAIFSYYEKTHFLTSIQATHMPFSPHETTLVQSILNDPDHLHQIVGQLPLSMAEHVLPLFKNSFMFGFRYALGLFVFLLMMTIIIVVGFATSQKGAKHLSEPIL